MIVHWTKRAKTELQEVVRYITLEFGYTYAVDFLEDVDKWVMWMSENPGISPQEPLLTDRKIFYRSRKVGKYNKLIFRNTSKTLYIVDLWDMRRDPNRLASRIHSK